MNGSGGVTGEEMVLETTGNRECACVYMCVYVCVCVCGGGGDGTHSKVGSSLTRKCVARIMISRTLSVIQARFPSPGLAEFPEPKDDCELFRTLE